MNAVLCRVQHPAPLATRMQQLQGALCQGKVITADCKKWTKDNSILSLLILIC